MIPLVLLPGMMCDSRLFAPQIETINDRAVMIAPITVHANMHDLAAEVLKNAPERFILGGLSMGGIVAMEVLRQAPERIEGLILMDTNPLAEDPDIQKNRQPQIDAVRTGELEVVMNEQMIPRYLHRENPNPKLELLCLKMALGLGQHVFERQSIALRDRPDQTLTLANYKGDALILHGEDDRLCPAHRHELMQQLMPQAKYKIIKNAGHLPTLEQPRETSKIIKEWLEVI